MRTAYTLRDSKKMIFFNKDCAYCGHPHIRHGTGKATEGGHCNNCNKHCEKFVFPGYVEKKDK